MATKIKLMRLGKMRAPYYRVVVADARTKRDGRSIETIGKYHPKEDPSFIEINRDRVQHWLQVGAQPTEAVAAILRVTGDWQLFKGEAAPPPMKVKEARADKRVAFQAAALEGTGEDRTGATTARTKARRAVDTAAPPAATAPTADQASVAAAEEGTTLAQSRADSGDEAVDTGTTAPVPGAADALPGQA